MEQDEQAPQNQHNDRSKLANEEEIEMELDGE